MKDYFLHTSRLAFSTWDDEDIQDAFELWGNSEVTKFIVANGKMTEDQVKQRLKKEIEYYNKNKIQYWPVYLKDTKLNIGCCGLRPYDSENNILELGIHLKELYWGKGYAYEACLAVIDYAFQNLKVNTLFAGHNPNNLASGLLLEKLGFRFFKNEFYQPTGLMHPSYLIKKQDYNQRSSII